MTITVVCRAQVVHQRHQVLDTGDNLSPSPDSPSGRLTEQVGGMRPPWVRQLSRT